MGGFFAQKNHRSKPKRWHKEISLQTRQSADADFSAGQMGAKPNILANKYIPMKAIIRAASSATVRVHILTSRKIKILCQHTER